MDLRGRALIAESPAMQNLSAIFESWANIIEAVHDSPIGLTALALLLAASVTILFLRKAPLWPRLLVVATLLIGVAVLCNLVLAKSKEFEIACNPGQFYMDRRHVDGRNPNDSSDPNPIVRMVSCQAFCATQPVCSRHGGDGSTQFDNCKSVQNCENGANDGVCTARLAHAQDFYGCKGVLRLK